MKKLRADSRWNGLPQNQRDTVLQWLFVDGLSYAEVVRRAEKEFRLKVSISSAKRFYHHIASHRQDTALGLTLGTPGEFKDVTSRIASAAALNVAVEAYSNDDIKPIAAIMKMRHIEERDKIETARIALRTAKFAAKASRLKQKTRASSCRVLPPPAAKSIK